MFIALSAFAWNENRVSSGLQRDLSTLRFVEKMAFSNEEIDAEFSETTNELPATARRIRKKSWMTDVTRGDDGTNIGVIGPRNPEDE